MSAVPSEIPDNVQILPVPEEEDTGTWPVYHHLTGNALSAWESVLSDLPNMKKYLDQLMHGKMGCYGVVECIDLMGAYFSFGDLSSVTREEFLEVASIVVFTAEVRDSQIMKHVFDIISGLDAFDTRGKYNDEQLAFYALPYARRNHSAQVIGKYVPLLVDGQLKLLAFHGCDSEEQVQSSLMEVLEYALLPECMFWCQENQDWEPLVIEQGLSQVKRVSQQTISRVASE